MHKNVGKSEKIVGKGYGFSRSRAIVRKTESGEAFPMREQHGIKNAYPNVLFPDIVNGVRNTSLDVVFGGKTASVGNASPDVFFADSYCSVENDIFQHFCASYS